MSIVIKHYGRINNGTKVYYDFSLYQQNLKEIESKGGEFVEVIKLKGKPISQDTYAFFFGGVIKTALEFERFGGWNKQEFREYYESKFLSTSKCFILYNDDGTIKSKIIKEIPGNIEALNQQEMNKFVEQVIDDLALEGIIILTPEQYYLEKYKTTHANK